MPEPGYLASRLADFIANTGYDAKNVNWSKFQMYSARESARKLASRLTPPGNGRPQRRLTDVMHLAIIASHPIQYHAPLFRELARRLDLTVFYAHRASPMDQARAGFGVGFDWDVDLLSGYEHVFLRNAAKRPGLDRFRSCDTPQIAARLAEGRFDAVLVMGWQLKAYFRPALRQSGSDCRCWCAVTAISRPRGQPSRESQR